MKVGKLPFQGLVFVLFLVFSIPSQKAAAREINVKEVKLSLFKKPVTGYRLVIDRHSKLVESRIIRHVAEQEGTPFQFEKTIIFENIMYPPVTRQKAISLYFLLHNLPGNYTELTIVAMYDYKRSISSTEFPDLSLKLLVDVASLVRKITGDFVKFDDIVFDDETIENIAQKAIQRKEEQASRKTSEHFAEEEVENNSVLVKKDPFRPEADSVQNDDDLVIKIADQIGKVQERQAILDRREQQLTAKAAELEHEKEFLDQVAQRNQILKDSLIRLNRKLASLSFSDLAGDDVSISDAADAVTVLEERLSDTKKNLIREITARDSLATAYKELQLANRLVESENSQLKDDVMEMRAANSGLRAEYLAMKTELNAISQSVGTNSIPANPGVPEQKNDASHVIQDARIKELNELITTLQNELKTRNESAMAKRLDAWDEELKVKDRELGDREKLIGQRETNLESKQEELKRKEELYSNIVRREEELKKLEQQLKNEMPKGTSVPPKAVPNSEIRELVYSNATANVTASKVNEFGKYIPVYVAQSKGGIEETEKQIASYMLAKGYLYREKFPDLFYGSVSVPGIQGVLTIRYRVESAGTLTSIKASFRLADGNYIENARYPAESAKAEAWMQQLLQYQR